MWRYYLVLFLAYLAAMPVCQAAATSRIDRDSDESEPGAVDVIGFYGQSFDFWTKAQELNNPSMTPSDIVQLLDSSFDHPQEGMAYLNLRYQAPVDQALSSVVNRAYFGVGADVLAGGVARNRILPEVEAYGVYTGHVDFGLMQKIRPHESGWEYRMGSTLGVGKESFIQGTALDFTSQFAPNSAAIFYSGLDLDLGFKNQLSESLKERFRVSIAPTLFHSDFSDSGSQFQITSDQVNVRWREENEWSLTLATPFVPNVEIGLLVIAGQQPTPISILPRTWDAVHDLDGWPSFGQLVGVGTRFRVYDSNDHFGMFLDGGFYGGYMGASAILQVYGVQLAAGTYGFEESSGYRIDESRIRFVSIGGQFAL